MYQSSAQEVYYPENTDIREEFARVFNDEKKLIRWKEYIRNKLSQSVIFTLDPLCTEEDILDDLTLHLLGKNKKWNKERYPEFETFLESNIQNVIKGLSDYLQRRSGSVPRHCKKKKTDMNQYLDGDNYFNDGVPRVSGSPIDESDRSLYFDESVDEYDYSDEPNIYDINRDNYFEEKFDREAFNDIVIVILDGRKNDQLYEVYEGLMAEKKRGAIMHDMQISADEYNKLWKRLKYTLRLKLPPEYRRPFAMFLIMEVWLGRYFS
jgi:hypothetical protein